MSGEESENAIARLQLLPEGPEQQQQQQQQVRTPSPLSSPERPERPSTTSPRSGARTQRPPRRTQFPGFLPGSSGGYLGTEGQGDWAMEREMEIQRLEEENSALRQMLGIADEIAEDAADEPHAEDEHPSPVPGPHHRPSLTVEELEASAEQEAIEALEAKERADHPELESAPVAESVLGFRATADPKEEMPESVFDETDGEIAPESGSA
jgi:hypothetical protein